MVIVASGRGTLGGGVGFGFASGDGVEEVMDVDMDVFEGLRLKEALLGGWEDVIFLGRFWGEET